MFSWNSIIFLELCVINSMLLGLVSGNTQGQSHWCPSSELRRVEIVKNVSLNGRPSSMRHSFQWKRELVFRCCPGFMGPNCDRACFSCRQWAELSGKVHHMEQYLIQMKTPTPTESFEPFNTKTDSLGKVCWTRDGRPVFNQISSESANSRGSQSGHEINTFGKGNNVRNSGERERMGYRNGCPIYGTRKNQYDDRFREERKVSTNEKEKQKQKSMYERYSQNPQRQKQMWSAQRDFRPVPSNKNPRKLTSFSRHHYSPSQKDNSFYTWTSASTSTETENRASHDQQHEAFEKRLSIIERQIQELEVKLSALGPRLSATKTMSEEMSLLAVKIDQLQQIVLGTRDADLWSRKFPSRPMHDISSTFDKRHSSLKLQQETKSRINRENQQIDGKNYKNIQNKDSFLKREVKSHASATSLVASRTSKNNSIKCETEDCKTKHSTTPPDTEVVDALFSKSPQLAEGLEQGHDEFYEESKRTKQQRGLDDHRKGSKTASEHIIQIEDRNLYDRSTPPIDKEMLQDVIKSRGSRQSKHHSNHADREGRSGSVKYQTTSGVSSLVTKRYYSAWFIPLLIVHGVKGYSD